MQRFLKSATSSEWIGWALWIALHGVNDSVRGSANSPSRLASSHESGVRDCLNCV